MPSYFNSLLCTITVYLASSVTCLRPPSSAHMSNFRDSPSQDICGMRIGVLRRYSTSRYFNGIMVLQQMVFNLFKKHSPHLMHFFVFDFSQNLCLNQSTIKEFQKMVKTTVVLKKNASRWKKRKGGMEGGKNHTDKIYNKYR